jgi:hypothetical protein
MSVKLAVMNATHRNGEFVAELAAQRPRMAQSGGDEHRRGYDRTPGMLGRHDGWCALLE